MLFLRENDLFLFRADQKKANNLANRWTGRGSCSLLTELLSGHCRLGAASTSKGWELVAPLELLVRPVPVWGGSESQVSRLQKW